MKKVFTFVSLMVAAVMLLTACGPAATAVPPTAVPPTTVPATAVPPTAVPPTEPGPDNSPHSRPHPNPAHLHEADRRSSRTGSRSTWRSG